MARKAIQDAIRFFSDETSARQLTGDEKSKMDCDRRVDLLVGIIELTWVPLVIQRWFAVGLILRIGQIFGLSSIGRSRIGCCPFLYARVLF